MSPTSKKVRLFVFFDKLFYRFNKLISSIHQGFWLGFLNRTELISATDQMYDSKMHYYTPTYTHSGLNYWEQGIIDSYFSKCRSILIGGAGSGREMIALTQSNYRVDGFECSHKMFEYCKRLLADEKIESNIYLCAPDTVPEKPGKYDGMIIGWGTYMHIQGRNARINFLNQCSEHIKKGGPILLSFFVRDPKDSRFHIIYHTARVIRKLMLNKDILDMGDTLDGSFDHYFTREEIESELNDSGFNMIYYKDNAGYPHAVAKKK